MKSDCPSSGLKVTVEWKYSEHSYASNKMMLGIDVAWDAGTTKLNLIYVGNPNTEYGRSIPMGMWRNKPDASK
jgi:hypothetical protein